MRQRQKYRACRAHWWTNDVLCRLRREHGEQLTLIDADLTEEADLQHIGSTVSARTGALHLVINAAGMLHAADMQPEKSLDQITKANLERVFALNAFAPILLAKSLMPLLSHSQPAVFASLSARVGSISDNRSGGWYAYRGSKAAQNQLMKTFAIELARRNRNGFCLLLHPGTVDTPLSAPFQARVPVEKLFSATKAASQLLAIIARSTPADTGRLIDRRFLTRLQTFGMDYAEVIETDPDQDSMPGCPSVIMDALRYAISHFKKLVVWMSRLADR